MHTLTTRARIRRWAALENLGMATLLIGLGLVILAVFASIWVAVWAGATDIDRLGLFWWIWGVPIGVTACGIVTDLMVRGSTCRAVAGRVPSRCAACSQ